MVWATRYDGKGGTAMIATTGMLMFGGIHGASVAPVAIGSADPWWEEPGS
jgi:hypothetical protein